MCIPGIPRTVVFLPFSWIREDLVCGIDLQHSLGCRAITAVHIRMVLPYKCLIRRLDHVVLDGEVLQQEFGRMVPVCQDPAHLGGGEEHVVGALLPEKIENGFAVQQVELGPAAGDEVRIAAAAQRAQDRRPGQAAVAGDEYPVMGLQVITHGSRTP